MKKPVIAIGIIFFIASNSAFAGFEEGVSYYKNNNPKEALREFNTCSKEPRCQLYLGEIYEYGKNGVPQNLKLSKHWFTQAANSGYAEAQYELGIAYEFHFGKNGNSDAALSEKYLQLAANQGLADAQYELGRKYEYGIGATKNPNTATKWIKKAAEQGDMLAEQLLGEKYLAGSGVEKSYTEALMWLEKSADQGDSYAIYDLGEMYLAGQGVPRNTVIGYALVKGSGDMGNNLYNPNDFDKFVKSMSKDEFEESIKLSKLLVLPDKKVTETIGHYLEKSN